MTVDDELEMSKAECRCDPRPEKKVCSGFRGWRKGPTWCWNCGHEKACHESVLGEPVAMVIKDRPGFTDVKTMRDYFEAAVNQTSALAKRVKLDCIVHDDGTIVYSSAHTHDLWIGWCLGMRCAERLPTKFVAL